MLFAIICHDKAGHFATRMAIRPDHLAYLEPFRDRILLAGPLLADDGETSIGSLLVVDFPDKATAERFAADDPYARGGLFDSVAVTHWRQVIPAQGS